MRRGKKSRITAVFFSPFVFVGVIAAEPDYSEHYVVIRTEAVNRLPISETGNLSPRNQREIRDGEVWRSNSCGFAEYAYAAIKLEEYAGDFNTVVALKDQPVIRARGHLGEWCRMEPYLFEKPTLVTLNYWDGIAHVFKRAEIHWDGDDLEYIDNPATIERNGWTERMVEIGDPTNSSNCFSRGDVSESSFEYRTSRQDVKQYGDKFCYSRGVYIRDLSTKWKEADFITTLE